MREAKLEPNIVGVDYVVLSPTSKCIMEIEEQRQLWARERPGRVAQPFVQRLARLAASIEEHGAVAKDCETEAQTDFEKEGAAQLPAVGALPPAAEGFEGRGSARAGEQLGAAEGGPLALSRRPVVDPAGTPRRSWRRPLVRLQ
ncbi:unnamed protein product [Prorocentrum cordatum]|uniref:Uncharacterized protein n=1 Tax=Prorocentrum cordatum TaxID=2364126 RepID=A0ABN9Q736_9DINO|nr:unnamed protein product [Polarella glacialis]